MTRIVIQEQDFSLQDEYERLRNLQGGAIVIFTGLVRDFNTVSDATSIEALYLQHYPGMTERLLEEIIEEARSRWEILDITVIHRVGRLLPGDQIVLVAVSSSHRQAAFSAASFVMDYLKTRATFWKKTLSSGGEQWLEMKESDRSATQRWHDKGGS